ncbi:coiled-coil domain-containing protein, partial [Planoprotostelium fungivorum]
MQRPASAEDGEIRFPAIKSARSFSTTSEEELPIGRASSKPVTPNSSRKTSFKSPETRRNDLPVEKEKVKPPVDNSNPFRMPTDEEVEDSKKKSKSPDGSPRVDRSTAAFRHGQTRLKFSDLEEPLVLDGSKTHPDAALLDSPLHQQIAKTLSRLSGIRSSLQHAEHQGKETENLNDFITKKREMFLLEYSLSVKREEIKKLDEIARHREEALRNSEKALEEDAARFDAFLKENNMKTMEAKRKADTETKMKLEKEQEIKRLRNEIASIQNELAKYDEQLDDCRKYKEFLDRLTPPEFLMKIKNRKAGDGDDSEEPMYFTDPQQLLDIFKQLEETNMFLIQNAQESERILEDLQNKRRDMERKMCVRYLTHVLKSFRDGETVSLKEQIKSLEQAIEREDQKSSILENRTLKNSSLEDQEIKLEELHNKVEE